MNNEESLKKTKKSKKNKEKRNKLSLYINGTPYKYGVLCTFCITNPADVHCKFCPDFYCFECDGKAHATKTRKDHVRSLISKYTLKEAGRMVFLNVRRFFILRRMQKICRKIFIRKFDRKELCYYYINTRTLTSSWKKPRFLLGEELIPFMTPDRAASICQGLYYMWKSRTLLKELLYSNYSKIFDRTTGYFYYIFYGKSKLIPKSNWKQPKLIKKLKLKNDVKLILTEDIAAIVIQRKWRAILVRNFLKLLTRIQFDEVWDPVKGQYNYHHKEKNIILERKPLILRNEHWDVNRIPDWSQEEVSIFLRRIKLKQYVETMSLYGVDGNALVLLDNEDYENLNITSALHREKIRTEICKRYHYIKYDKATGEGIPIGQFHLKISDNHFARREKIRRQKKFNQSAIIIQKNFRRFSAQKVLKLLKEIKRVSLAEEIIKKRIESTGAWWTSFPSIKNTQSLLNSVNSHGALGKNATIHDLENEKNTKNISNKVTILPRIKNFGRRCDRPTANGWGHYKSLHTLEAINPKINYDITNSNYKPREITYSYHDNHFEKPKDLKLGESKWCKLEKRDIPPPSSTSFITEKLFLSGYDDRRKNHFISQLDDD